MTWIDQHYDFPGPWKAPFAHQIVTSELFAANPRAYCFNDIGTGKTPSALWSADLLMQQRKVRKVLIVAPLSTLRPVWAESIFTMFPGRRSYTVVYGDKEQRLKRLTDQTDFYILNHDGLKTLMDYEGGEEVDDPRRAHPSPELEELLREVRLIIVDEGAVFRNSKTDLWLALRSILRHPKVRQPSNMGCWWMTGNPAPNHPSDLWAQGALVRPDLVPIYFGRFRDLVSTRQGTFRWLPRPNWEKAVYPMFHPSVRYQRTDCLDLPPEVWQTREVELSTDQHKVSQQIINNFYAQVEAGEITAINEGVSRVKLLQVYAGAVYTDDHAVQKFDLTPRLRVVQELFEETGKLILFVPFKHLQRAIMDRVQGKVRVALVNGDVSERQRTKIFNDFQKGNLQLLLAHPECMAHGLNLTAGNVIVWWCPLDDNEIYEQACGRIKRAGQTRTQVIVHLCGSPLEREIYRRLRAKEKMSRLLLDMIRDHTLK